MKASDAIARLLAAHGVTYCFEMVGGMITHLLDSISSLGQTRVISMHHEQAAAFAAEGVARASLGRQAAVAMGTSGPGATNLLTGIGDCWFDSVPVLFITGQVNRSELKGERPIRQQGFQELDIVAMARPITKLAVQIAHPEDLLSSISRAIRLMREGRPGPVLVDIPNDLQRVELPDELVAAALALAAAPVNQPRVAKVPAGIEELRQLCGDARRPLVCFGGGARWAAGFEAWIAKLESCGIPYVSTLMGHERVPAGPGYFNMIGAYGNREANWAVQNCDLLLVVGARLDVRQTGGDVADFARKARVVQVDVDPGQINNRVQCHMGIEAAAEDFFAAFVPSAEIFRKLDPAWMFELRRACAAADVDDYPDWPISPALLFRQLNETMRGIEVDYVCDVGNHQMWAAHGLRVGAGQAVHYSGGMGAMGFALPTALGIALHTGRRCLVLTGDGSLQVNIQELDTLARLGLEVGLVVMNNQSLGMVKNFQDLYFDGRDQSTRIGYSCPEFTRVAGAYGIEAMKVGGIEDLGAGLHRLRDKRGPFLLELNMPYATECRPRLAFGKKLDEQLPAIEGLTHVA